MTLHDITRSISAGTVVWEGDPLPNLRRVQSLDAGDSYNLTRLDISAHTSTHVDAPLHFVSGGAGVERLPLDVLVGPAWVADLSGCAEIHAADLVSAAIPVGVTRLLLKTGSMPEASTPVFDPNFAALALDGARWLLERGVRLVGIDTISIESYASVNASSAVHHALLEAGLIIIENLELSAVTAGAYRLTCLPLKLVGADGSPARVILESEAA